MNSLGGLVYKPRLNKSLSEGIGFRVLSPQIGREQVERGYLVRAQVREVIVVALMFFLFVEAIAQEEGQAEVQPAVEAAAEPMG